MVENQTSVIAEKPAHKRWAGLTVFFFLSLLLFFYMSMGCAPVSEAQGKSDFKFLEFFDPY